MDYNRRALINLRSCPMMGVDKTSLATNPSRQWRADERPAEERPTDKRPADERQSDERTTDE